MAKPKRRFTFADADIKFLHIKFGVIKSSKYADINQNKA